MEHCGGIFALLAVKVKIETDIVIETTNTMSR